MTLYSGWVPRSQAREPAFCLEMLQHLVVFCSKHPEWPIIKRSGLLISPTACGLEVGCSGGGWPSDLGCIGGRVLFWTHQYRDFRPFCPLYGHLFLLKPAVATQTTLLTPPDPPFCSLPPAGGNSSLWGTPVITLPARICQDNLPFLRPADWSP